MSVVIHRRPTEPTSTILPCCGRNLVTHPLLPNEDSTTVDRQVTCKPQEDLGLNDVVQALVDSITGPKKVQLLARLREIRAEHGDDDFRQQADDLLRGADLPPRFVDDKGDPEQIPHGEPGHACLSSESLMQVQDLLNRLLEIIAGHQQALIERDYPEPMVYAMVSNLHATLLQRML